MRVNESGSMATFVIVGLVLAALVVGGIYAVQQRKDKAPSPSPVAVKSSASPAKSTPAGTSASPSQKPQSPSSVAPAKPSPSVSHAPSPKPTPVAVVPHTSTAPMPQTGPNDTILSAVMLATFSGMAVAYVRSIQARRQLSHQVD
jgi:hypothetical protein